MGLNGRMEGAHCRVALFSVNEWAHTRHVVNQNHLTLIILFPQCCKRVCVVPSKNDVDMIMIIHDDFWEY